MKYTNKVLDFNIVANMHSLVSSYASWKKYLWKHDRRLFNGLKLTSESMKSLKETMGYKLMSGAELSVERGLDILNSFKKNVEIDRNHINYRSKDEEAAFIKIDEFIEEATSLIVLIEMTEHQNSIFC